ncbi:alpha/beta fold hydrolase [Streptomyces sp. NRRL S-87]|uniref:alpha/beta fold hydrolase n=1 Tax=Streptomyces sp. NRRL S-87 TaxID=1463920 RepID=UPI000AFCE71D|nr:alpha/beta fold hydrolase [Streptomyces sp. NRRL S-87]
MRNQTDRERTDRKRTDGTQTDRERTDRKRTDGTQTDRERTDSGRADRTRADREQPEPEPAHTDRARADRGQAGEPAALLLPPARPLPAAGVKAAVLLLHGGREAGLQPPSALNPPDLRMRPFARAIGKATASGDVLVARVRYRHRGWNGHHAHPVADVHRALDELRGLVGPVPVVLVGHSMGGRAALRAAAVPGVAGVIALAPWCPPDDGVGHLRGRTVVAFHDEADRVTAAADTWSYLARAHAAGARAAGVRMPAGAHTMIRGARHWHRLTARTAAALLGLGDLPAAVAAGFAAGGLPRPAHGPAGAAPGR